MNVPLVSVFPEPSLTRTPAQTRLNELSTQKPFYARVTPTFTPPLTAIVSVSSSE
jgi:hypothetical protein